MQLQIIVVVVFSLRFCKTSTKNAANLKSVDSRDNADTPSPEWIKYQQERFQESPKLISTYQNPIKTGSSVQSKTSTVPAIETSKIQTTSRQKSSLQEEIDQVDYETNSLKHSEEPFTEKITSAVEFPSIKGFIEFVKSLKQTWMQNSLFRIDDKIKMLHQLKDSLLKTIERQFMILWQDDENEADHIVEDNESRKLHRSQSVSHLRSKRGILDESSINFPPDAALISINFLTFAVFLIKLVLQVVNIVKSKHYQLSSFNMDTGAIRNG